MSTWFFSYFLCLCWKFLPFHSLQAYFILIHFEHCYNSCIKVLVWSFQHLAHVRVGLCCHVITFSIFFTCWTTLMHEHHVYYVLKTLHSVMSFWGMPQLRVPITKRSLQLQLKPSAVKETKIKKHEIAYNHFLGGSGKWWKVRKWEKRILCDKGAKCVRPMLSARLGPSTWSRQRFGPRVSVRDSGAVGLTVREESAEFTWGLKMLREKASWKCQVFFPFICKN